MQAGHRGRRRSSRSFGDAEARPDAARRDREGAREGERARRQGRLRQLRRAGARRRRAVSDAGRPRPPVATCRRGAPSAARRAGRSRCSVAAARARRRAARLARHRSRRAAMPDAVAAADRQRAAAALARHGAAPRRRRASLTGIVGVGTAWLVTAHRFPGRDALAWLLPLPLAVPTYITAYVYVEMFDAAGPVQAALRRADRAGARGASTGFPRSARSPAASSSCRFVLYPYVYLAARAMFLTQSACDGRGRRARSAPGAVGCSRTVALPLARPALAVGARLALLEALNDIGASEYLGVRTLTVSVYHDLAQPRQPRRRGADRLPDARGRRRSSSRSSGAAAAASATPLSTSAAPRVVAAGHRCRAAPALAAALACALPVLLGFVLPAGFLVRRGLRARARRPGSTRAFIGASRDDRSALALAATLASARPRHRGGRRRRGSPQRALAAGCLAWPGSATRCPARCWRSACSSPLVAVDNVLESRSGGRSPASRSASF